MKAKILKLYMDWYNNFLTVEAFAEHHKLPRFVAVRVLDLGRRINHQLIRQETFEGYM